MNNIKLYRKRLKITQQHLSDLVACDRSSVSRWELEYNKPREDMQIKIAQALDCSIDDLFNSEDKEVLR